uniref:Uncharacterized protein n=1 Tax=Siphoviridae sp. ctZD11 TaxID=2825556 RepID=A0A8S5U5A7_9CAUD|nr:MAG TPA: hypothetical protein [Siphoviridae sp. ctZD11]DAI26547.1 MAG TPA: hypothetical protein [Caudoviricetes sp.]DAK05176.1 MAG TPA: hypothetical protein [Caudoviricetes sp.]DAP28771.1 MAG TPA: hypothetical protein [Caudoviricetes sp.]
MTSIGVFGIMNSDEVGRGEVSLQNEASVRS